MINDPRGEYSTLAAPPLSLAQVSVRLGKKQIVSNVSLTLNWGDTLVLLGANGAGKSTLIKTAIGELIPQKGTAELFGIDASRFENWERVGYVQQLPPTSALRFPATSLELVQASCTRIRGSKARRARAYEALEQVGMQDFAHQIIGSLSGGQLQRVRLAASMASLPDLLILDEPTTGIDQQSTHDFFELIDSIKQQRALSILLVTHDQDAINLAGGSCMMLESGCLHASTSSCSKQEA